MAKGNNIWAWSAALVLSVLLFFGLAIVTGYVVIDGLPDGFGEDFVEGEYEIKCRLGNCKECWTQAMCEAAGCVWHPAVTGGEFAAEAYCGEPPEQPSATVTKEKGKATASVTKIYGDRIFDIEIGEVEELSFRKMSLDVKKVTLSSVKIVIEKLDEMPEEVTAPAGDVYQYIQLTPTGITDDNVNSVTFEFAVERDWIGAQNIDITSVNLKRWDVGSLKWEELLTTEVDSDAKEIVFSAVSPGFSIFTITGEEKEVVEMCSGKVSLSMDSTAASGSSVTASVSGLSNCAGRTAYIKEGSCEGTTECTASLADAGGSCDFTAPLYGGFYDYYACFDIDEDGNFSGDEIDSASLQVFEAPAGATQADADSAISSAQGEIDGAQAEGKNTTDAEALLAEAQDAYALGDWETAVTKANAAESAAISAQIITVPQPGFDFTIIILIAAVVLIAVGAAGLLVMKRKKRTIRIPELGQ
ncbi:MAG: PGF-pre-PGF domain-containing protein [Candidatus Aenigmatarchaeota archaeon]